MKTAKKVLAILMSMVLLFSFTLMAFADDEACAHSVCFWKVEREATANYDGVMVKYCTECSKILATKNFTMHTHTPGHEETLIEPYCETTGEAGVFCAVCGAIFETKEIPALGHSGGTSVSVTGSNLEIVFLIDESGSMSWSDSGEIRKEVAKELADNLGTSDKAAVVAFDGGTRVLTEFTNDKDIIKNAIDQAGCYGGTDMYLGLKTSFSLFAGASSAKRYIVMLTDGDSYGYYDYATAAAEKNVVIYTVGLGSGVNSEELETIAATTGGEYYFANAAEDLFDIYEEITEEIVFSGGTWVTTVVPTCSTAGERVCYCSRCGKMIGSEKIAPAEHEYSASVYMNTESHTGTCVNCGNTITENHTWGSWEYNGDNTFFRDGTMSRTCTGCQRTETQTAKHTSIIARIFYPCFEVILSFFNRMPFNWITSLRESLGK